MNDDPPFGWRRSAAVGLSFRRIADDDLAFLGEVYLAAHKHQLAATRMTDVQKAAFMHLQFRAEHAHYLQDFPNADFLVVMGRGLDLGRLYLDRRASEHRILDISLLPEYRGKGAGKAMLRDLMDEAAAAGKPLAIEIESANPAMRLFRRLDFKTAHTSGSSELLLWKPQPKKPL